MYSYGSPHVAGQKQDDQLEHTSSSYVRIRDAALKTYQRRWTIWRSGERGSRISVPVARHDDDDDDDDRIVQVQHLLCLLDFVQFFLFFLNWAFISSTRFEECGGNLKKYNGSASHNIKRDILTNWKLIWIRVLNVKGTILHIYITFFFTFVLINTASILIIFLIYHPFWRK